MFILEFFKKNKEFKHEKVTPDKDFCYCPDCGELIENCWYITRCSCCGVKLKAIIKNGKVIPDEHFCHNCGASGFLVEKVDKINFIDINYAVLVKAVVNPVFDEVTQSWIERTVSTAPKLLRG